jgi:hypothetical protein
MDGTVATTRVTTTEAQGRFLSKKIQQIPPKCQALEGIFSVQLVSLCDTGVPDKGTESRLLRFLAPSMNIIVIVAGSRKRLFIAMEQAQEVLGSSQASQYTLSLRTIPSPSPSPPPKKTPLSILLLATYPIHSFSLPAM